MLLRRWDEIRAIVFDVDGTLVQLGMDNAIYARIVSDMIEYAMRIGVPPELIPDEPMIASLWRTILSWSWRHRRDHVLTIMRRLNSIIRRGELLWAERARPIDRTLALLRKLKAEGVKAAVFTFGSYQATIKKLARAGIHPSFFKAIVTREFVLFRVKPDPYHLAVTLRLLEVKPEDAVVIGDSDVDRFSAEALGCKYLNVNSILGY